MRVRSRHNSKQRKAIRVLVGALIVLLIGFLAPKIFTGVSRVVLSPVYAVHTWFSESTAVFPMYLRERKALTEEIKTLKNELAIAQGTNLTQQRLFEENNWLRQLLGAETEERIAAAVLARPNELPYDFLQIDRGAKDGVVVGAPVYIGKDNVIGLIAHTANSFSFVELFTTPGFEATAFISGPDVVATVEGYGGGVARVRVPQGISLSIGNVVHVPSIQPGAFGRISYIENQPSQPEQYGYITLNKPINGIHYVAVGREALPSATIPEINEAVQEIIEASVKVDTAGVLFSTQGTSSEAEEVSATSTDS